MLNALFRGSSRLEGQTSRSGLSATLVSPRGEIWPRALTCGVALKKTRNVIKMYLSLSSTEAEAVTHTTLL